VTEYGKAIPVDLAPSPDGNLVLVDTGDRVVARVKAAPMPLLDDGAPRSLRFASHFVTCPYAAKHRRRRNIAEERQKRRLITAAKRNLHLWEDEVASLEACDTIEDVIGWIADFEWKRDHACPRCRGRGCRECLL
jgi:hypothetical protein